MFKIRNFETENVINLVRSVTHNHPDWVHTQMNTKNEEELQSALDNYDPEIYFEDMKDEAIAPEDMSGVFLTKEAMAEYALEVMDIDVDEIWKHLKDVNYLSWFTILGWRDYETFDGNPDKSPEYRGVNKLRYTQGWNARAEFEGD